jgi:UDP-N-acetylmuramyl pentapeptide synthase
MIIDLLEKADDLEVFLVGPVFARICKNPLYSVFSNENAAHQALLSNPLKGKTILVKGSRGIHLERLNDVL